MIISALNKAQIHSDPHLTPNPVYRICVVYVLQRDRVRFCSDTKYASYCMLCRQALCRRSSCVLLARGSMAGKKKAKPHGCAACGARYTDATALSRHRNRSCPMRGEANLPRTPARRSRHKHLEKVSTMIAPCRQLCVECRYTALASNPN